MQASPNGFLFSAFLAAVLSWIAAPAAQAQTNPLGALRGPGGIGLTGGGDDENVVQASGAILPADGAQPARLRITATIKDGWHIYSITQKPGGPLKTKLKIPASPQYTVGEFKALTPPTSHPEPVFDNLIVEEHSGQAIWEAPLEISRGVGSLKISGAVNAQACKSSCLPPTDYRFEAVLARSGKQETDVAPGGTPPANVPETSAAPAGKPADSGSASAQPAERTSTERTSTERAPADADRAKIPAKGEPRAKAPGSAEFHGESGHLTLRGRIEPAIVAPGDTARVVISAFPEPPFHTYALADRDDGEVGRGKPTLIELRPTPGLEFAKPQASLIPISNPSALGPLNVERYYGGSVDFVVEVRVAADAKVGDYPIEGVISYQTCTLGKKDDALCDRPAGASFRGVVQVLSGHDRPGAGAAAQAAVPAVLTFNRARYHQPPDDLSEPELAVGHAEKAPRPVKLNESKQSLFVILVSSFLGGLILNLMPCVLPVIGLKLLSFVTQAGQHRSRVLALNLWYTAGLMIVFMVLATLACGASLGFASRNLGWGQHFSSAGFVITMCSVVFVMALSLLGVWEIPIPGFVGVGKGTDLAAQEGPAGAFFKGVMSTILATPCSGPFLASVFGFTVKQPPSVIYLIFAFIGLGMASPYLLVGAFPSLIRWLPKPGAWMDTFKQLIGFSLLGAVVYLLSTLEATYRLPTLGLILGLSVACWWLGRTPLYAEFPQRLAAWGQSAILGGLIGYVGFVALLPQPSLIVWQDFKPGLATQLATSGKTVMVEFTADWCPTCKTNLKFAINTEPVKRLLEENAVTAVLADWTKGSDEIGDTIKSLHGKVDKGAGQESIASIPVLAIYPAGRPNEPLVLDGIITQSQLLDALEKAGPSDDAMPRSSHEQRVTSLDSKTSG